MEGGLGTGYYALTPPTDPDRFTYLIPVGQLPGRSIPVATRGANYTIKMDPIFRDFVQSARVDCSPIFDKSNAERVRPLLADLKASIQKCDVPRVTPSFLNPVYKHAFELVWQYIRNDLTVVLTPEICKQSEFNMSASSGFPYTAFGFRTKADAFGSDIFHDLMSRCDYVPLDTVNSKDEFLDLEELNRNKLRTTFGAPLDKVAKQKLFFDAQNTNILKSSSEKWIQYGMTKQYGGFDRAIKRLESFTDIVQSDASGWDRNSFLGPVYILRLRGLRIPYTLQTLLDDTVFHSVFPTILLPDGAVVTRITGNDSGGNNTASDNSILHLIIVFHLLCEAYFRHYGELPDLETILMNSCMLIYSDDKLGGLNCEFFGLNHETFAQLEQEIYAQYGMVIKPSSILVTSNKGRIDPRHEFLGSFLHFHDEAQRYIPYPRIGKICSSVTRIGLSSDLTPVEYFMKTLQLTLLAYMDEEVFSILVEFVHYLIDRSNDDPEFYEIINANNMDEITPLNALRFHLGWEVRALTTPHKETTLISDLFGGL